MIEALSPSTGHVVRPRGSGEEFRPLAAFERTAAEWLGYFDDAEGAFAETLEANFGSDPDVLARRRKLYTAVLKRYAGLYGEEARCIVVGVPSRVNWEGHHVDHQGGFYNATTHENELVLVAGAREDSLIVADSIDARRFPRRRFSIADERPAGKARGDWGNYIKGGCLAVRRRFPERTLHGAQMVIGSDIPIGAGLSSSHALVLASMLGILAVNRLRLDKREAVIGVQEGEWYTGSRTGLGDQATMVFGRRDRIFYSTVIEKDEIAPRYATLPDGYARVLINSFWQHSLQGPEKHAYNIRVFGYKVAFPLILNELIDLGCADDVIAATRRLAEISPDRMPLADIYRALRRLPASLTLDQIRARLSRFETRCRERGIDRPPVDLDGLLETYFGSAPAPDAVLVRGVAMYGLAECRRSALFGPLLEAGRIEEAGQLATLGHEGDRVARYDEARGEYVNWSHPVTDELLDQRIADAESAEAEARAAAALERQIGDYRASIPVLDQIVDTAIRCGAASASLTGAGLGGVVTVIIREAHLPRLRDEMLAFYRGEEAREMEWVRTGEDFEACFAPGEIGAIRERLEAIHERKAKVRRRNGRAPFTVADQQFLQEVLDRLEESEIQHSRKLSRTLTCLPADYDHYGVTRNVSIAGAGYLEPPPREENVLADTIEETLRKLRREEESAIDHEDWERLEALAWQLQNVTYQLEREAKGKGRIPPKTTGRRTPDGRTVFLVTGAAGFIGSNLCRRLLGEGHRVIGVDEFNDYYDPVMKYRNVGDLLAHPEFELDEADFRDFDAIRSIFRRERPQQVIHLGARAGVRPSVGDPQLYVTTNILGMQNLLELAKEFAVTNFLYASSSSVYGGNREFPFREDQPVDSPISPYAATKRANEIQAFNYSILYGFPVTGFRFFTVYGPGGRPDMAIRKFIEGMMRGKPIPLFGDGTFERDYTYIDDILDGVMGAIRTANNQKGWCEVFNLGESETTDVREIILLIARQLGRIDCPEDVRGLPDAEKARLINGLKEQGLIEALPPQKGDVPKTFADIRRARERIGYDPKTKIEEGIARTVAWHLEEAKHRAGSAAKRLDEAITRYAALRVRAGLDRFARPRDPRYTRADLEAALRCQAAFEEAALATDEGDRLADRLLAGCYQLIGDIAASLRNGNTGRPWGIQGLAIRRKRQRMIQMIQESCMDDLSPEEEREIVALAEEIIEVTGARPMAVVCAAAGYGTRLADSLGGYERKHRAFFGDDMIRLSLRSATPYANHLVIVASRNNQRDIQNSLHTSEMTEEGGFRVNTVIQEQRFGDGDAHLTAAEVLENFDGVIVFLFSDAPTRSPETVRKTILVKQALGPLVPLVVPTVFEEAPYSPLVLVQDGPDRGRVIWNWQKADEEDYEEAVAARKSPGLRNVGLFVGEASVFAALRHFKEGAFRQSRRYQQWLEARREWRARRDRDEEAPREPEFGFADLMKVLPRRGIVVAAPRFAEPTDMLNVNNLDDAEKARGLIRERVAACRLEIERDPAHDAVAVKVIDLDGEGRPLVNNGAPSYRNYTYLRFPEETDLDSVEVEARVREAAEAITSRIREDLGLDVLS